MTNKPDIKDGIPVECAYQYEKLTSTEKRLFKDFLRVMKTLGPTEEQKKRIRENGWKRIKEQLDHEYDKR